jgi:hypothetical protein
VEDHQQDSLCGAEGETVAVDRVTVLSAASDNAALLRSLPFTEAEWLVMLWQTHPDISRVGSAFPDFADAPFKNAVVQIGFGKLVAKLFVRVLENSQTSGLHGSEILG